MFNKPVDWREKINDLMSSHNEHAGDKVGTEQGDAQRSKEYEEKITKLAEENHVEVENCQYLVRGASLQCSCGSHKRRLNLPIYHGVYVNGKPMIYESDCVVGDEENITTFGVCNLSNSPLGFTVKMENKFKSWFKREKILLQKEDGTNVRGYACTPQIVGQWKDVHEIQTIAENESPENSNALEDEWISAVTENSFLVCMYGGIIKPVTSGQEDGE